MGKHTPTPGGTRMNYVYDEIRIALRDMPPDRAEVIRGEILVVLALIKVEAQRWRGSKNARNRTPYKEGSVIEAVGGDYAAMKKLAGEVSAEFSSDLEALM